MGCEFCIDLNASFLQQLAISNEKIAALPAFKTSQLFDDQEKIALSYAECVTKYDRHVDDALFAALQTHFSQHAIVELTATIAFQNLSSKFNMALEIESQHFCLMRHTR